MHYFYRCLQLNVQGDGPKQELARQPMTVRSVLQIYFINRWLTPSDCSRAVRRSSFSTVRLQAEQTHRGSWRALGVLLGCDVPFWPGIPASEGTAPSLRSHRHKRQRSPAVYGARWFKPNVNGVCGDHGNMEKKNNIIHWGRYIKSQFEPFHSNTHQKVMFCNYSKGWTCWPPSLM